MVCRSGSTTHCPEAVRQSNTRLPLPTAPSSAVAYRKRSIAHYPKAMQRCTARSPLPNSPNTPKQCSIVLQEFHCPVRQGIAVAVYHRSPTVYYSEVLWHYIAGSTAYRPR